MLFRSLRRVKTALSGREDTKRLFIAGTGSESKSDVFFIESGGLLDRVRHPNQKKYAGQEMFVVLIEDYVYLVPFIESERDIFLKTIIPSRKATKDYFGKDGAK